MKSTTDFSEITVFGARGHTLMILRALEEQWRGRVRIRALVDDIENGFDHPGLAVPVISSAARLRDYADLPILLTVAKPALRRRLAEGLIAEGATLATACFPDLPHVDPDVQFGPGSITMPWTRIGPGVKIGACVMILASGIGHDVEIGDFSTLAMDSALAGHVKIGEGVNIAPRAAVMNGSRTRMMEVGRGAEIGSGAAVIGRVAAGERVIGNPAMPLRDWVRLRRLLRGQSGTKAP